MAFVFVFSQIILENVSIETKYMFLKSRYLLTQRFPVEFGNINDHRKIIKTYLVMKKLTSDNGQSDCDEAGNHKISNSPFNPKFLHGKLVYLIENVHGVV